MEPERGKYFIIQFNCDRYSDKSDCFIFPPANTNFCSFLGYIKSGL